MELPLLEQESEERSLETDDTELDISIEKEDPTQHLTEKDPEFYTIKGIDFKINKGSFVSIVGTYFLCKQHLYF